MLHVLSRPRVDSFLGESENRKRCAAC